MTPEQAATLLTSATKTEHNTGALVFIALIVLLLSVAVIIVQSVLASKSVSIAWEMVKLARGWDSEAKRHWGLATEQSDKMQKTVETGFTGVKLATARSIDKAAATAAEKAAEVVAKITTSGDSGDKIPRPPEIGG